jgi:hypothetical protein
MAKKASTISQKMSHSKKPGKKPKSAATGIGVISSIEYTQDLKTAFASGVNDGTITIKFKHKIGYNPNQLNNAIDQFNQDSDIGLIVTVGGLVVYQAAETYAAANAGAKPFLSLVGGTPSSPSSKFRGGVSLESYTTNPNRIQCLIDKGYLESQICLFSNPNSAMQPTETGHWGGANPIQGTTPGSNNFNTYQNAILSIPVDVTAIVISADPYFYDSGDALIRAANNSNRYVCYPLLDYASVKGATPNSGSTTLYGPSLTYAYSVLGQRAVIVVKAPGTPVAVIKLTSHQRDL